MWHLGEHVYGWKTEGERRWFLQLWDVGLQIEGPDRWRLGPFISWRYGDAYTEGFVVSAALSWHISLGLKIPFRLRRAFGQVLPGGWPDWHRSVGIHLTKDYGWIELFYDSSARRNRRWQKVPFWQAQWLLGRERTNWGEKSTVGSVRVDIGQWKGDSYVGEMTLRTLTQRNRWRTKHRQLYDLSFDGCGGIPIPGNGENSWDCGDDAIFGVGFEPPMEVDERIRLLRDDILQTRQRRRGKDWRPAVISA